MTLRERVFFGAMLVFLGAGWGFTQPMTKIAVSTGYEHFGLLFWQMAIGAGVMTPICLMRRTPLPKGAAQWWTCLVIAMVGSLVPNSVSYQTYVHLPAGILAVLLSMIPIFAFPIALALGLDRFEGRRMLGLAVGLFAVLLLILPGADMGADMVGPLPLFWIMAALLVGLCYAFEGNYVAKWGTAGLDPAQVLWGASIVGTVIALPLALGSGQWIGPVRPYTSVEFAHIASSVIHVLTYMGYVWLVGRAGPVFAVQISYVVTLAGIFWAALILGERYPALFWVALFVMLIGMALVQPRRKSLDGSGAMSEDFR